MKFTLSQLKKLIILPFLRRILVDIRRYLYLLNKISKERDIYRKFMASTLWEPHKSQIQNPIRVIHFYPEAGNGGYPTLINMLLDKALTLRGAIVDALICQGEMYYCTTGITAQEGKLTYYCKICKKFSKDFLTMTGANILHYKDFISVEQIKKIRNKIKKEVTEPKRNYYYKGIDIGYHVTCSTDRYFMLKKPTKIQYLEIYKEELINAIITVDVAEKLFQTNKYDVLIMQHGVYSSWGSFVDYARSKGIRDHVWGYSPFQNRHLHFDIPKKGQEFKKYLNFRGNSPLSPEENSELDNYMKQRYNANIGQISQYRLKKDLPDEFFKELKKYKKVFMIFPNLLWDPGVDRLNTIFSNIWEWVDHTIKLFINKPDYKLIIKTHPADAQSIEPMTKRIIEKYPILPPNITVLPADIALKSYDFYPYIDAGIVYSGTPGIELALAGKPAITAGLAQYAGLGFTYDAKDKNHYNNLILGDEIFINFSPENTKEKARLFAYFYFIKSPVEFKAIKTLNTYPMELAVNNFDFINPGKDKNIDRICDYILGKQELLQT